MTPEDRARADIVDYCLTKRDRWHGYDAIPGQIDHDLANAYASVAEALTEQQPEPVSEDHVRMFIQDCAEDADLNTDGDDAEALAVAFTNRYIITRKPQGDA
jgi:hypothetical protein